MDLLKKYWNILKLYRCAMRSKHWALKSTDTTKRKISVFMFNTSREVYNQVKPRWLPAMQPLGELEA